MARPSDPHAKVKLLAAAEAVFVERGLDGAKIEEIAARAGLGKGSFYLHFPSKDDAFRQLIEVMVARMATTLDAIPEDCSVPEGDVAGFLDLWVSQDLELFEFVWANRGLMRLLLEGGKSASYRHLVDEFLDRAAAKIRRVLLRGREGGIYRGDLDVDVAATFMAGAYDRLARQITVSRQRPDLRAMLRQVQFLVLRGIGSAELLKQVDEARVPRRRPVRSPQTKRPRARARRRSS
jgi:AcrR family transcriptional regulator